MSNEPRPCVNVNTAPGYYTFLVLLYMAWLLGGVFLYMAWLLAGIAQDFHIIAVNVERMAPLAISRSVKR